MDNTAFNFLQFASLFIVGSLMLVLCCLVWPAERERSPQIPDDDAYSLGLATPPIGGSTESDTSDATLVS